MGGAVGGAARSAVGRNDLRLPHAQAHTPTWRQQSEKETKDLRIHISMDVIHQLIHIELILECWGPGEYPPPQMNTDNAPYQNH